MDAIQNGMVFSTGSQAIPVRFNTDVQSYLALELSLTSTPILRFRHSCCNLRYSQH